MADEEEEDYMSDALLLGLDDNRPGLLTNQVARKYQKEAKSKNKQEQNKTKPLKLRENEHREAGLTIAIDSSNKGFALLQKMGYKQGMGLGKSEEGRTEPIPLSVKAGRGGLGQETELKRKQVHQQRVMTAAREKRAKVEEKVRKNFREQQKEKFSVRQIEKDLFQSQKACEQLDKTKNLSCKEEWYWPIIKNKINEDEDEEEEEEEEEQDQMTSSEKLILLTEYLREVHCYCIWCGSTFQDEQDLRGNCPGDTYSAHDE